MSNKEKKILSLLSAKVPESFCPVVVGKICSSYGILGWLKVLSFTEKFCNIINYQPWFVHLFSKWRYVNLENWKKYRNDFCFIVKFQGIFDRDVAQLLNNHKIFVDVLQFPALSNGEYYWRDIIGCRVIGICGYRFGTVVNLIETGANDVLIVNNKDSKGVVNSVYLIPFIINKVIKYVDCADHVISVDWNSKY